MKLRYALVPALLLVTPLCSLAQSPTEPKFRIEIQKDAIFTVTNLSDKTLTACAVQLSGSTDAQHASYMSWDSLTGTRGPHGEIQGPLEPGASMPLSLVPAIPTLSVPNNPKLIAGIWADGETFGDQTWIKMIVKSRANLASAYEQAIAILKQGIEANWTRQQYLAAMGGLPLSLPLHTMLQTFQTNQALDEHPQTINNLAQHLLDRFQQSLQLLRPQKPAEPAPSGSAKS
jgi:hypothetical protein